MKLYQQEQSQLIHREATRGTLTRNHLREGLLPIVGILLIDSLVIRDRIQPRKSCTPT